MSSDATQQQTIETSEGSSTADEPSVSAITLLRSGGAIKGISEKFAANPVTGTGSLTIPLLPNPGRSNFGPQLSLYYGAGNDRFGFRGRHDLDVRVLRSSSKYLGRSRARMSGLSFSRALPATPRSRRPGALSSNAD